MFVDIFNTDKKYNIIYADPPWKFSSKQLQKENGKRFNSLDKEYRTVKTNQMQCWDIKRICDDKTAKCINKVSKMADKRKAKATDLKAISDILDQINSKYHKDF